MKITTVGIDLAKNVFQVHGIDERGKAVLKKQFRRDQMATFFVNLPPCLVGMEACGSAHHWARKLQGLGHTVRLMETASCYDNIVSLKLQFASHRCTEIRVNSLSGIAGLADLNEHALFNRQKFDQLTLGDMALQRQLIESFLRQNTAACENLISAAHASNEQFDDAIHRLKSTCHFVAADRTFHILRAVRATALLKNEGGRTRAAQAIVEELQQLEKALLGVLSERGR